MKIDIVISNPPYNKGMDIDFVLNSFNITSKYLCVIVPAKWKSADANQHVANTSATYGVLRSRIVNHIKKLVFYPCCKDVFDILQVDGISYFIVDKSKQFNECNIVNKCSCISSFNSETSRSIINGETLLNIGQEIVDSLGNYNSFKFIDPKQGRYQVWTNKKISGGGFATMTKPRQNLILGESRIEDTEELGHWYGRSEDSTLTFSSDRLLECQSFLSYINTRFVRFFVAINISKLTNIMCDACFKFVPAPPCDKYGAYIWDTIYTDEYLYNLYKLDSKYIEVIESIIKSRRD